MPTYVYRTLTQPTKTFELHQSIHAPPLTHHPETGEPVERVLYPPTIATGKPSDAEIRNAGLTKYTRTSDGTYEKH